MPQGLFLDMIAAYQITHGAKEKKKAAPWEDYGMVIPDIP